MTVASRAQLNLTVVSARRHRRARKTKYTGTEVGGELDDKSHRKDPRNSGREGRELSVVGLSVFAHTNPSRDIHEDETFLPLAEDI